MLQCNQYTHMVLQQQKWQLNHQHLNSNYKLPIKQSIKHTALASQLTQADQTEILLYSFRSGFFLNRCHKKAIIKLHLLVTWQQTDAIIDESWKATEEMYHVEANKVLFKYRSLGKSYRILFRLWFASVLNIQRLETFHYDALKNIDGSQELNVYLPVRMAVLFCIGHVAFTLTENKSGSACIFSKVPRISEVQTCYGTGALDIESV